MGERTMTDVTHVADCTVPTHDPKCPRPHELSDGTHHWWSGWPGAFCLGCFCEDPLEYCITACEHLEDRP